MALDPADRCQYGHQLVPGSVSISVPVIEEGTGRLIRVDKFLLRNHAVPGIESVLAPHGMVPAECEHGLAALPAQYPPVARTPLRNAAGEELPPTGRSWIRSRYVRPDGMGGKINCPVCRGEPEPPDMKVPADVAG